MDHPGITFNATFSKATTLVDGGWRLSLDLSENDGDKITELAMLSRDLLQVAIIPIDNALE